jgi:hypothetical protein
METLSIIVWGWVGIGLERVRRTESGQGPVVRFSAGRSFFVVLGAFGVGGGVAFGLVPTPEPFFLSAAVGFVITTFSFSVVGGFGMGIGWVQIGPEGLSGLTYRGRRLVPWHEARFVAWVPSGGGPPGGGWTRPAVAAYREAPFGRGFGRDERLIFVRLRFIVTRRQEVRVARQLLEACRRFGSSTSVQHRPGYGLVHEAMWKEIEN